MAKSKAKKLREKLEREGRRNPESLRSPFATTDLFRQMRTKATKTKKDKLNGIKHRNQSSNAIDDGSFLFV